MVKIGSGNKQRSSFLPNDSAYIKFTFCDLLNRNSHFGYARIIH